MPRLRHATTGAVVDVSEETAGLLGSEWAAVDPSKSEDAKGSGYRALTKADLKAAIEARNDGRDPDGSNYLPTDGNKADLVAILEADDAANAASE